MNDILFRQLNEIHKGLADIDMKPLMNEIKRIEDGLMRIYYIKKEDKK